MIFQRGCLIAVIILLAIAPGALSHAEKPDAFLHVHVIPMDREGILDDQTVLIEDGKITALGPSVRLPPGTHQIDATGKYLIPGLTDAHVHLYSTIEFPLYLANGVTTVFNLDGHPAHLFWRKQIANGKMLGPRIFTTGPIFGRAHKPDEAMRIVDEQADAGYDAVKIFNQVSKAEFRALIAEAKRRHLFLMGHISREAGFELTIQSGQSLAHLDEILYTYFNPQHDESNDHIVLDESKMSTVAKQTANAGVYLIPTLHTYATTVQQTTDLEAFLKNPDLHFLPPWALEEFQPPKNRFKAASTPEQSSRMQSALTFQRKLVKTMFDEGVPLLAGSDAPDVGPMAGFGLHDELQELARDGLSPYQVLRTATANPALYFGRAPEFGTIEPGKRADLVLLERNPLVDIANTRAIVGVMLRGMWLSKADLANRVQGIPEAYRQELHKLETQLANDPVEADHYLADHDPMRSLSNAALIDLFRTQGPAAFHQLVRKARVANPKSRLTSEAGVNALGYNFLAQNKYPEAIAVLRMNTEDFPTSPNTFDSLAEALAKSGDISQAREAYAKALSIDPGYTNADFAQKFVAQHASE